MTFLSTGPIGQTSDATDQFSHTIGAAGKY